jgi:glucose-6-phosphate 1-dehydrogenase
MENPQSPPPAVVVIFGASGDLTRRKLVPALHSLACAGLLSPKTRVLGVARSKLSDAEFRDRLYGGVADHSRLGPTECALWPALAQNHTYLPGQYDDLDTYRRLGERLGKLDSSSGTEGNALFYLATPPALYPAVIANLGLAGLSSGRGWRRVIIEKPFGHDLGSAQKLNGCVHQAFGERQVFRIDHYLGKETVQNILTFRFANAIFEPLWNRNYIDHIQITVSETVGVGHRAGYYDQAGVVRDMFQNHLLQLLTLTAMEPAAIFEADALRDEKVKVLRAVRPIRSTLRAQYRGYRDEPGVAVDSATPTYAALKVHVDNWRWRGVPFYLRSGKRLKEKTSEIAIQFRGVPHLMFPQEADEPSTRNVLSICIQPDEGIHLRLEAKEPGWGMRTRPIIMDFHHAEGFGAGALPDAYERLLLDAIQGDASLFARADEIELAWGLVDPILATWRAGSREPLCEYDPGSWGPAEADAFLAADSRSWYYGCGMHPSAEA